MFTHLFVLLILIIKRCEARSVSIIVRHQQFFAVEDAGDRSYIPVSKTHERLLQLTNPSDKVDVSEDPASKHSKDTASADHVANDREEHTGTNINRYDSKIDSDNVADDDYGNDDDDDDDDDENEANGTTLDDFLNANPQNIEYSKIDDVNGNDKDIESISGLKKLFRKKRSAHEQWKSSLPGAEPSKTSEDTEPDIWEEVSDEELKKAQLHTYKQTAIYLGWTLLSVVGFVFVGICFLRDPIACIFAFGTGCPCCLICCPCIRAFTDKYLDSKKIAREQMNKYMPGVILIDDGSLEYYKPTGDELDILAELIDEMQ